MLFHLYLITSFKFHHFGGNGIRIVHIVAVHCRLINLFDIFAIMYMMLQTKFMFSCFCNFIDLHPSGALRIRVIQLNCSYSGRLVNHTHVLQSTIHMQGDGHQLQNKLNTMQYIENKVHLH